MRKKIEIIDRPALRLHIDYDHLTVGELGNILIRLQAALRGVAGLSPGEYDGRYCREQPRFVTSYISTKKSIDIELLLAVLAIALQIPSGVREWSKIASQVFRWFKVAILATVRGDIKSADDESRQDERLSFEAGEKSVKVAVTRGKIDIEMDRPLLDELTSMQRRRLADFVWSLTGPARRVTIGDDESEISLEWTDEDKYTK
jgi:hypothetical protein